MCAYCVDLNKKKSLLKLTTKLLNQNPISFANLGIVFSGQLRNLLKNCYKIEDYQQKFAIILNS